MKNILIKALTFFLILFSFNQLYADNYTFDLDNGFNSNLTQTDRQELLSGKTVYKNLKSVSNISLTDTENVLKSIKELKPNYIAEIIRIIPVSKKPELINELYTILNDIPSYKGIPYYSERNDLWVDLYSEAKIIDKTESADWNSLINAEFYMKPFGTILSKILIKAGHEDFKTVSSGKSDLTSLYYENINTSPVLYRDITCIKPQKMKSVIYVFKSGDYWILYGIGGADAPRLPFLTSRIEVSFINRIKTFCNYVFSKLDSVK